MEDVKSKHYADTAKWVCKVIESCTTPKQELHVESLYEFGVVSTSIL